MHGSSSEHRIGPIRLAIAVLLILLVSVFVGKITTPSRVAPVSGLRVSLVDLDGWRTGKMDGAALVHKRLPVGTAPFFS